MEITLQGEVSKEKLLSYPKRILYIAKNMGADVRQAEKLYDDLVHVSFPKHEMFQKVNQVMDMAVEEIIEAIREEFERQDLGEYDIEKHLLTAMVDLKKCTPESIRRAQESINKARSEAKELKEIKKEALDTVSEIEAIMRNVKDICRAWSTRNEYEKIEGSLEEINKIIGWGKYELALIMAKSTLEKAKELRDIKLKALRHAAKAGHIVGKLKGEKPPIPEDEIKKLDIFLGMVRYLLEDEDYKTALLLAKAVKRQAESLLPSDRTGICKHVCPICFDTKCPNTYCDLDISPSPLLEETCRTYCHCGSYYHICCVQKVEDLTCVSCYRPLME